VFHHPLGGQVEFGEQARDAVQRQVLRGIGQPIERVRFLGVIQSIFVRLGVACHEINFVYSASLVRVEAYELEDYVLRNSAHNSEITWRRAGADCPPLYPTGLAELIDG
jgi:ADP-ribose pyrophosphatase YjhB (NUDIX family)